MTDLYSKIAKEEGVSRMDVKQLAFGFMYSFGAKGQVETQIRQAVKTALKLGMIKKVKS